MSAKHKFNFDEARFKPKQREAAIELVEYEFATKDERKGKQQIADELGITRATLHKWDTKNSNFIAYKNYLASEFIDSNLAFVYKKLLDSISNGSVRGIETFLKRIGDLDTNSEVTIKQDGAEQSFDERKTAILDRLDDAGDGKK